MAVPGTGTDVQPAPTTDSYRTWLQSIANGSGLPSQEAGVLLQVVGNDGGVNGNFLSNPYGYTGAGSTSMTPTTGHIVAPGSDYGYGPQGVSALNQEYYRAWQQAYNAGNTGGGSGAPGADQADTVASLSDTIDSLQRLLSSSNTSKSQGLSSIDTSFGNSVNAENQAQAGRERVYNTQLQDNATAKQGNIDTTNTNARTAFEALQRMLGIAGGGVSSAAVRDVPYAVSRYATQQRTGAINTAAKNERDINMALQDTVQQHQNTLTDLGNQKADKTREFLAGILQHQSDINAQLAQAVTKLGEARGGTYTSTATQRQQYTDAISKIQGALDNLFNQYKDTSYTTKPVNPIAVNPAQYAVDPLAIRAGAQNPGLSADVLPYLALLRQSGQYNPLLGTPAPATTGG